MVRTRRRPRCPSLLSRRRKAWTSRWVRIRKLSLDENWATKAVKDALKKPLLAMTWGKCAFCEGKLGSQAYPQIEHYISRKVDPHRAFDWMNLLPVCQRCNSQKGHEDHKGKLLKPDTEDPELFFWIGPEGDLAPHPALDEQDALRASETIRICGLNRGELCEDRLTVSHIVKRWLARTSNTMDEHALDEWNEISDPRFPYKLVIRYFLPPPLADNDRSLFHRRP